MPGYGNCFCPGIEASQVARASAMGGVAALDRPAGINQVPVGQNARGQSGVAIEGLEVTYQI